MGGPPVIHLPDGQKFTVKPVFAGLFFQSQELSSHSSFPVGWTVVLHTADGPGDGVPGERSWDDDDGGDAHHDHDHDHDRDHGHGRVASPPRRPYLHSFTKPTLQRDHLFISSISIPSSDDFKPAASPSRQVAMMLWVSLYWYFHQPHPDATVRTDASRATPDAGKPRGDWRIHIQRDGVLRGRNLIPKLERMGLIASLESCVGTDADDPRDGWSHMFVSRRMFWQIPGRLFLFSLQPTVKGTPPYPGSPASSRPATPSRSASPTSGGGGGGGGSQAPPALPSHSADVPGASPAVAVAVAGGSGPSFLAGPFFSASHLPTYYPPPPLQYVVSDHVRHPVRPKPPRMGEVFYNRFVPSVGQYLSFRVASLSDKPVPYLGPVGPNQHQHQHQHQHQQPPPRDVTQMSDAQLLETWLANPRVRAFWGDYQPGFLAAALSSRHSFPAIGLWDGVPFGYFELYWVKEDQLGRLAGTADDWDRGFHVLIGEEWARGRVQYWLSSIAHWAFCADFRTMSVCVEPRVDNARFIQHLQFAGFSKEKEVAFPHKQAWLGRLRREAWEGPAL